MNARPKLLIHSNAPYATTGYGIQTGLFASRLSRAFDVGISCFYGLEGNKLKLGDIWLYPGLGQTYGNESIGHHATRHFGGDPRGGLVMTLIDVWVLSPTIWRQFNTCCWVPVDHEPAPPMVRQFFDQSGAVPLAMSRFGMDMLADFDPLYVPHGVDTNAYRPYDQAEARRVLGLPEQAFLVGMVAANKGNPSRKCFAEALQAFAAFRERHDDAILYLHTEITGRTDGVNLPMLIRALGLPDGSVLFTDQGRYEFDPFPADAMARVYSAMDVLLNPSAGEGFGITPLEAQACGTPAIVTDFSAMREVCGSGWHVDYERTWTTQMSWQARPSVEDIVDALQRCYGRPRAQVDAMSRQAREHALAYDVDRVVEQHMLPALAQVADRYAERAPVELKVAA